MSAAFGAAIGGFTSTPANLRDAVAALHALDLGRFSGRASGARDALFERLDVLQEQESERARGLASRGGPETLVHGDLWPTNVLLVPSGAGAHARLIDWDEAAVGPIAFDLSTLLLRFDSSHRHWILDAYRRAVEQPGRVGSSTREELNPIFETAAYARLLSLLVWNVAGAVDDDSDWLPGRMAAIAEWLDEVTPVLPPR